MIINRRIFSQKFGVGALIALSTSAHAASSVCQKLLTPEQPEGPFYPISTPPESDVDLTRLKGSRVKAKGEEIIVDGQVLDENCNPIHGAVVEIWQACHSGKYNHPSDNSNNQLDQNFQYYGQASTDTKGRYRFKTILPGAYAASANWTRPPHIHFKVSLRGYTELITQMYFAGQKLNKHDRILQGLQLEEQKEVVVALEKDLNTGLRKGVFNIGLKSL